MSPPDKPLSAADLDELLSADLDGELERAAPTFGLSADAAREAIATPEARARREALAEAARVVAAPVDLPARTADRIVTDAIAAAGTENELDAARRRRERRADASRRVLVALGAAAAAIVVIVGLSHLSGSSGSGGGAKASAPSIESNDHAGLKTNGGTFGAVANRDQLRRRVAAQLHLPNAQFGESTPNAEQTLVPTTDAPRATSKTVATPGTDRALKPATCTAPAGRAAASSAAPVLSGAARWRGRSAYVFVFRQAHGYEAVVVAPGDCTVITTVAVP